MRACLLPGLSGRGHGTATQAEADQPGALPALRRLTDEAGSGCAVLSPAVTQGDVAIVRSQTVLPHP